MRVEISLKLASTVVIVIKMDNIVLNDSLLRKIRFNNDEDIETFFRYVQAHKGWKKPRIRRDRNDLWKPDGKTVVTLSVIKNK